MRYLPRKLARQFAAATQSFPVVALSGSRRSDMLEVPNDSKPAARPGANPHPMESQLIAQ
jgi:hypothetical protein